MRLQGVRRTIDGSQRRRWDGWADIVGATGPAIIACHIPRHVQRCFFCLLLDG